MVKIDEKRMGERPEGVTEEQWRAKLTYEAVQQAQAPEDTARTDTTARDEARKVVERERAKRAKP